MYHNLLDNTADELELLEMELNMTQLTDFEDGGGRRPIFLGGSPQPAWKNDSTTPPSPINVGPTLPAAYHDPEVRRRLQQMYFPNEGSNVELSRKVNSPVTSGFGSQASNVQDINKVNKPTIPKHNTYVHTPDKMVLREPVGVDGINDTGFAKDYLKDVSRDSDLREHKLFYPPMYKASSEKEPIESSTKKASVPQTRAESKLGLIRKLLAGRTELERACETFANEKTKYTIVLEILKIPVTLNEKYEQLDLMNILTMNQDPSFIPQVPKALDTIEKYAQNLLKPIQLRPFSWKVIKFSSEAFQTRVQHLKGGIPLLKQLGYVDVLRQRDQAMGLGYVETAVSRDAVLQLAVDLCIAKFEVEAINNRSHCHMTLLDVPGNLPLAYQRPSKDRRRSFTNSKDLEKLRGRETEMFRASSVGERPQGTNIHGPHQNIRNTNTAAQLQSRPNIAILNQPVPSGYEVNSDEKFLRQIRIPNAVNQPSMEPPPHNSPYSVRPDDTTWVVHGNLSSPGAARILHEDLRNPFLRMEPRTNSIVFEQPRQPLSSHQRFHSDQMNMRTSSYQQMRVPNPGIRQHSPRTEYVGPEYAITSSMQETQTDIDGTRVSLPLIYQRDSTVAVTPNSRQQRYSFEIADSQYNPVSEAGTSPTSTSFRRNSSTAVASSIVNGSENKEMWPPTSKDQDPENGWNCKHCTYLNPYTTKVCQMCDKTSWVKELGPEARKRAELIKVEDYFKIPENQLKYVIFPQSRERLQNLRYHHPPNGVDVHSTIIGGGSGAPLFQSQAQPLHSPQSPPWFNPCPMMPLETGKHIQAMRQMQNRDNIQTQSSQSGNLLRPGYGRTYDGTQVGAVPNPGIPSQMSTPSGEQTMQAYQRYILKKKKESVEKVQRLKKEQEKLMNDAKYVVELLKTVEKDGYSVDEFAIAASYSPAEPLKWLKECRQLLIEDVVDAFAETCQSLGRISIKEAKKALIKSSGDFEDAVAYTRERRQKDIDKLQSEGLFKQEAVVEALSTSHGDVEEALCTLERNSLKPFLDRIWAKDDRLLDKFYLRLKNKTLSSEERIRMVLAQIGHVPIASWGRANSAVRLIDETDHSVEDCIEAALSCGYFDMAKRFLEHECALCYTITPMGHLTTNLNCQCHVCYDCFKDYVTINLKEKHIRHLICPCCQLPNMDDEVHVVDYFNNIGTLIWNLVKRKIIDESTYRLFDIKVRDLTLKKDPNFRWCAHCPENGFIWDDPSRKMICNKCGNSTCFDCEEKWLPQHDGVSCEDFRQWKEANDPEYLREQAANLASQLARHGIRCPECNFTYDLARGGCMHFHCSQCGYEFCSGCSQAFRNGAQCTVHESCALKGLHAHHPRDCLYYMRDVPLEDLKKLLVSNNVQFDTEEPEEERGNNGEHLCHVMEQHETENGMKDEECQAPALKGSAGLCEKHYKEYLIKVANDHGIDPLELMDIPNVTSLLRRSFLEIPVRENQESDEAYLERLKEGVKEKLPLPPRRTQRRQQPNLVLPAEAADAADAANADEVADPAPDVDEAESNEDYEPQPDIV